MNTRASMKQQTRRRLIDAALDLSSSKGFAILSLREVTQAAGLTPAAFYGHFRDMEDLGLSLLDEVAVSLRRLLREARIRVVEPKHAVVTSVDTFLEYINENRNLFRLLLGERQGASTTFRKALHGELEIFVKEVAEDLEKAARAAGEPEESLPFAAEAIVAVVFTVGAEALDLPKNKQAVLRNRLLEEIRIILRGALWGGRNRRPGPSKGPPNGSEKLGDKQPNS